MTLKLWKKATSSGPVHSVDAHTLNISAIDVNMNQTVVATGSRDYSVKLWESESFILIKEYSVPRNIVTCLKFNSDNLLYQVSNFVINLSLVYLKLNLAII